MSPLGFSRAISKIFGGNNQNNYNSAEVAKGRLRVMIQQQRSETKNPFIFQQQLTRDIIQVVSKYWDNVDTDDISVNVRQEKFLDIFEMQIKLPKTIEN